MFKGVWERQGGGRLPNRWQSGKTAGSPPSTFAAPPSHVVEELGGNDDGNLRDTEQFPDIWPYFRSSGAVVSTINRLLF